MSENKTQMSQKRIDIAKKIDKLVSSIVEPRRTMINSEILQDMKVFYSGTDNPNMQGFRLKCDLNKQIYGAASSAINGGSFIELAVSHKDGKIFRAEINHRRVNSDGSSVSKFITVISVEEADATAISLVG